MTSLFKHSISMNVVQARRMSEEGHYVPNKKYDPSLKEDEHNMKEHFRAKYAIIWPSNIHEPIEFQFAQVVEL